MIKNAPRTTTTPWMTPNIFGTSVQLLKHPRKKTGRPTDPIIDSKRTGEARAFQKRGTAFHQWHVRQDREVSIAWMRHGKCVVSRWHGWGACCCCVEDLFSGMRRIPWCKIVLSWRVFERRRKVYQSTYESLNGRTKHDSDDSHGQEELGNQQQISTTSLSRCNNGS